MNEEISPPATLEFKDRKTGLIVFGILTMCLGGFCALMVVFMVFAQLLPKPANTPQNPQGMIFAMVIYGGLVLVLVVLGIGSIMARRWARALLLIFSWSSVVIGVSAIASTTIVLMSPDFMASMQAARPHGQPALPAATMTMITVITVVILGILFVVLPAIWIFFYGSKHVKATCEARDPSPCWTDRCPLPVLAMSIWLALWVPMAAVFPLIYHGVLPFFGMFLTGLAGSVAWIVVAMIWGYSAWALYKLRLHGWWVMFVSMCLFGMSSILTYSRHDITESYRLMGSSEEQIALVQKHNFFQGDRMMWLMLISTLPWLVYFLWIRKFFGKATAKP